MEFSKTYFLMAVVALAFGAAGALAVIHVGGRSGLMDTPGKRSSHHIPTPKGGGIGILVSFLVGSILSDVNAAFMMLIVTVSVLGLLSDRMDISPNKRLIVQFLCAFGVILFSYENRLAANAIFFLAPIAGSIFIVGTANFYNFMDGIDGIAGITAVVAYGLCGVYFTIVGYTDQFLVLIGAIVGSAMGFLFFNIPKAKIFMGDVGSILLGFLYACIIVVSIRSILDFVCTTSFLFLFYADELTTMVVRIRDGDSLLAPHRRHLYQILANELGWQHWVVSAGYGIVQLMIGIIVLCLIPYGLSAILAALSIFFLAFTLVTIQIRSYLNP